MNPTPFPKFLEQFPCILGEGAVIERLRRNSELALDPSIVNSAFIYNPTNRAALEAIYRQYLDIGSRFDLPLIISTPTWRASRERIAAAGYTQKDVNGDNFRFLDALRSRYGAYADKVAVCGLLSCRNDAYHPEQALAVADAKRFHAWQATALAGAGVDFLLAATLPAHSEATGLALAMAATGKPYMISFVVRPEGTLLDGTPLKVVITDIDTVARPRPLAYLVNCTHATIFRTALLNKAHSSLHVRQRVVGLLANTAALEPEALDNRTDLVAEAPETFGRLLGSLHRDLGMKILGGCCGTDEHHIRSLAKHLAAVVLAGR